MNTAHLVGPKGLEGPLGPQCPGARGVSGPINTSGLVPKGRAVLIRPYEPEKQAGLIEIPDFVQQKMSVIEQRAIVIAIGPSCWKEESEPRATIGDKVLVSGYAGYMAVGPKDKQQYRFINDKDIFAQIVEEG